MSDFKLTRIVSVFLNGERLPVKAGGAKYTPSKSPKKAIPGLATNEILGYVDEEPVPAQVEVTIAHTDGLSMQAYKEVEDATITLVTSGGKTYTLQEASYMDHGELSPDEWSVTFAAKRDAEASGGNTGGDE